MKRCLLLFIAYFFYSFSASPFSGFPPDMLVGKTYAQRYYYIDFIYDKYLDKEDSITFFKRANEIKQLGIENNDPELEREAELLKLGYLFRYHPADSVRCTVMLSKLLGAASAEKDNILLARLNGMAGGYYWDMIQDYARAFEYYTAEYALIKDMSVDEYPAKQKSIYILGDRYFYFRDYPNAIYYLAEAFRTDIFGQSLYFTLQATNTVGLCYQQLGNLDSADYYFMRANAIAVTVNNEAWEGITSGNIGYNYFLRGKNEEAVALLQKDLYLSVKREDWGCASGSLMVLAEINLAGGNTALAQEQAVQAREWIMRSGQEARLKNLFPLLAKLQEKQGNPELAALYNDSTQIVKENIESRFNKLVLARQNQEVWLNHQHEVKICSSEIVNIAQSSAVIAVSIVLSVFITSLLYRQRHSGLRSTV